MAQASSHFAVEFADRLAVGHQVEEVIDTLPLVERRELGLEHVTALVECQALVVHPLRQLAPGTAGAAQEEHHQAGHGHEGDGEQEGSHEIAC